MNLLNRCELSSLLAVVVGLLSSSAARANAIFVANAGTGTIGEYTTSGATVNAALISGLSVPFNITVDGLNVFVAIQATGTIGEYTTSGATVNAALISGLSFPHQIAVSGSDLFVAIADPSDAIGEYTTSGVTVNAALISGFEPFGIAVDGPDLFVTNVGAGTIGEYTTSGATVNASLISGLSSPEEIVLSGSDLFVVNQGSGTIGEYTTSGVTVNASLISGLNHPAGIAIVPTAAHPPNPAASYSSESLLRASDFARGANLQPSAPAKRASQRLSANDRSRLSAGNAIAIEERASNRRISLPATARDASTMDGEDTLDATPVRCRHRARRGRLRSLGTAIPGCHT